MDKEKKQKGLVCWARKARAPRLVLNDLEKTEATCRLYCPDSNNLR
jgi:hypothetical protein